jgi:hypothetical protein
LQTEFFLRAKLDFWVYKRTVGAGREIFLGVVEVQLRK